MQELNDGIKLRYSAASFFKIEEAIALLSKSKN
jgi:hypothetical protein